MRHVAGGVMGLVCLVLAGTPEALGQTTRRVISSRREEVKKQADEAYRKGDYPRVIELTDEVLREDKNDHVALYLRGSGRVELGLVRRDKTLVRDGIDDAREAIRIQGRGNVDYYLPYLYGMSNLSAMEDTTTHAETALGVATNLLAMTGLDSKKKANLHYQRALVNMQLRRPADADKDLGSALGLDRQHLAAHLQRCDLAAQSGNPEEALQKFNQAVAAFPSNAMVLNNRAMFHQSQGRVPEALADFNQAIQRDANFVPAWTNRGFTRLSAGDATEAEKDLTRSLQIDPKQPAAYSLRGAARLARGKTSAAIEDYREVLRLDPRSPIAHADLGFARFFAKDHAGALQSFDEALQIDAAARFLNPWRAAALSASRRADEAETVFRDVINKPAAERDWSDVLTLFALERLKDNELLGAMTTTDVALKDAQQCEAYYFIGLVRARQNQLDEAQSFFRQSLQSKSTHLSAYRGAQYGLNEFRTSAEK